MTNYIIYSVHSVIDVIVQLKINGFSTVGISVMLDKKHTMVMNKNFVQQTTHSGSRKRWKLFQSHRSTQHRVFPMSFKKKKRD